MDSQQQPEVLRWSPAPTSGGSRSPSPQPTTTRWTPTNRNRGRSPSRTLWPPASIEYTSDFLYPDSNPTKSPSTTDMPMGADCLFPFSDNSLTPHGSDQYSDLTEGAGLSLTPHGSDQYSDLTEGAELESPVHVEMTRMPVAPVLNFGGCEVNIAIKEQAAVVGVFLTWDDLWVSASDRRGGRVAVLRGITGYARPGEVLAVMGPSGSGKSTLLDSLAGRLGSGLTLTGDILVNGRNQALTFGTSAYVTQDDVLMTTLTVREAVYYSAQLQLPSSMTRLEKLNRAESTVLEMGLSAAMDTRIGGWAVKGLSGGQKRRLSICMEILTRPPLLFLDEPTSGLDSAASFHVMSRIVGIARREGMTVVSAIHQPSNEVFELFGGLCLLSGGRTVWFGPPTMTNEFFALNGFPCPSLRNPSDHYLRTVNKDFDKDIEKGLEAQAKTTMEAIEILVDSYKSSIVAQQVSQKIADIRNKRGTMVKKRSQSSFIAQSIILTRRSFVNMYRDLGYYWLRFGIYIVLCLCVGTIYYDIGYSFQSIQARASMLMFVAAFLTFMAIGGFPSFVEDMKIFGRERLNGHYGVSAFVIGNAVSSIPYLALISLIPGLVAYYLVGLQKGFEHFAYFALVLFMCMMVVEGLMMIVASIVPDFLMGIITGAGIQGVMMLSGGFFRLASDLPKPVWRYPMYYIAFHKYANEGFYKNEFTGLTFANNQAGGAPTIAGEEVLRNILDVGISYSKWTDLIILFAMVILYRVIFFVIMKTTEKILPKIKIWFSKNLRKQSKQIIQQPDSLAKGAKA